MTLSHEDVQDILALLDSLPYDDVTLETSRFSLRLRRAGDGVWAQESQLLSEPVPAGPDSQVPVPAPAPAPEQEPQGPAGTGPHDGLLEVRAPLLGTFYRAPEPGAAPFVDTGSTVAEDTVVAIIETMKLMNAVHAGVTGTVAEICLADGQFAPQGTVLMRVRPAAG